MVTSLVRPDIDHAPPAPKPIPRSRSRRWQQIIRFGVLLAGGLLMSYPLLWMISSSVKPDQDIFTQLGLIPRSITWSRYTAGWSVAGTPFHQLFLNSLVVAGGAVIGNIASCSVTAYAFARLQFPLKRVWFALMMSTIMLPAHVTLVPKYILFNGLGWVGTYLPLIVPTFLATEAFFIFLLVQFIRVIPIALDEAARIDGCNPLQVFWYIIMPMLRPALATTAVFTFIWTYNDFFTQLIYISDPAKFTVPLGLANFVDSSGESQWGNLFAMSTVSLLPILILFTLFQRHLIKGFATSGLK